VQLAGREEVRPDFTPLPQEWLEAAKTLSHSKSMAALSEEGHGAREAGQVAPTAVSKRLFVPAVGGGRRQASWDLMAGDSRMESLIHPCPMRPIAGPPEQVSLSAYLMVQDALASGTARVPSAMETASITLKLPGAPGSSSSQVLGKPAAGEIRGAVGGTFEDGLRVRKSLDRVEEVFSGMSASEQTPQGDAVESLGMERLPSDPFLDAGGLAEGNEGAGESLGAACGPLEASLTGIGAPLDHVEMAVEILSEMSSPEDAQAGGDVSRESDMERLPSDPFLDAGQDAAGGSEDGGMLGTETMAISVGSGRTQQGPYVVLDEGAEVTRGLVDVQMPQQGSYVVLHEEAGAATGAEPSWQGPYVVVHEGVAVGANDLQMSQLGMPPRQKSYVVLREEANLATAGVGSSQQQLGAVAQHGSFVLLREGPEVATGPGGVPPRQGSYMLLHERPDIDAEAAPPPGHLAPEGGSDEASSLCTAASDPFLD
jgi:hypothetical protein